MPLVDLTVNVRDFTSSKGDGELTVNVLGNCSIIKAEGDEPQAILDTGPKKYPIPNGKAVVQIHSSNDLLPAPPETERPKYKLGLTAPGFSGCSWEGYITADTSFSALLRVGGNTPSPAPPPVVGVMSFGVVDDNLRLTLTNGNHLDVPLSTIAPTVTPVEVMSFGAVGNNLRLALTDGNNLDVPLSTFATSTIATAADGDSSTKIANTEFVHRAVHGGAISDKAWFAYIKKVPNVTSNPIAIADFTTQARSNSVGSFTVSEVLGGRHWLGFAVTGGPLTQIREANIDILQNILVLSDHSTGTINGESVDIYLSQETYQARRNDIFRLSRA